MIKSYLKLIKPGIIMGNAITAIAGFALASKGHFNLPLFFAAISGLSLIIGSACALNNYIDRTADSKMARTQNRPLVKGYICAKHAIIYAILLGIIGTVILAVYTNLLTTFIALFGFFAYIVLYTNLKYLTVHGTLIGGISGGIPPVVGYCAVSNQFDTAAFVLFMIVFLWQMPHFYAIAMYRIDEYKKASIPVLPVKQGMKTTKIQILLYLFAFLIAAVMPTILGYTGYIYLGVVSVLGLAWLGLGVMGFKSHNDKKWARQMFIASLVMITMLCIMVSLDIA